MQQRFPRRGGGESRDGGSENARLRAKRTNRVLGQQQTICHFWRPNRSYCTWSAIIVARNVVDSNETSRPLPAIRSARSFLFPKSNENRPFSNSEMCSGLLLLRGMIFVSHFSSSSSSSSSSFRMSLDNFRHFKTRDLFEEEQPPRRKEK